MGRLSNPTDLYFMEEIIEQLGEELRSLRRNEDGTWTVIQKNGVWKTENTPNKALMALYRDIM